MLVACVTTVLLYVENTISQSLLDIPNPTVTQISITVIPRGVLGKNITVLHITNGHSKTNIYLPAMQILTVVMVTIVMLHMPLLES